jgi:hypothetical protein
MMTGRGKVKALNENEEVKEIIFADYQCPFKNSLCRVDCALYVHVGVMETAGCCAILSIAVDLAVIRAKGSNQD